MPLPRDRRSGGRLIGGLIALVALATLVGPAPSASATTTTTTTDDYPYRGLGKCPLVPLPPHPPGPQPGTQSTPGSQPTYGPATHSGPSKPGQKPVQKPGTPTVKTPPVPRVCAKHIWFVDGSYSDPWGFALRNCTSFVAWRMRDTNGVTDFSNTMDGGSWGDAGNWDDNARSLGYLVDGVPAVGAIAQTDDGRLGHVAWVSAVGQGTVTVEEYNYYVPGGYDVRTVPTSDFRYLHVSDLSPDPGLGSTRAAVSTLDADGRTWTARTTAAGDLVVRRPSGHQVRVGQPGAWSPYAAPSLVADTHGRIWLAAVAADGRLVTAHTGGASSRWTRLHAFRQQGWSTTSTPTLAVDGQGRLRLFSVTSSGDLVARHTISPRSVRWGRPDRMGQPGSWSTQAAPAVATDRFDRLWLVAVTRGGSLQSRHTGAHGTRWTGFHPIDQRTWSVTSSPTITVASDGKLWLASVTSDGHLLTRHTDRFALGWQRPERLHGVWSPYSSPALAADSAGRLWLAATSHGGRTTVLSTSPGSDRWQDSVQPFPSTTTLVGSPALANPGGGRFRVATVTAHGRLVWRRAETSTLPPAMTGRPQLGVFTDDASVLSP